MRAFLWTAFITFFLSLLLQSLIDPDVFVPSEWGATTLANVCHTWFAFFSVYYLFGYIVQSAHNRIHRPTQTAFILILLAAQLISFLWFLTIDLLFYFLFYQVESLNETTFFEFDLPLSFAMLTIGSFYFYQRNFTPSIGSKKLESIEVQKPAEIEIITPKGQRLVSLASITLIYTRSGLTRIQTLDLENYTVEKSLSTIAEALNPTDFFRVNRQLIVSREVVKGYVRLDYQKLAIELSTEPKEACSMVVSKYRAPTFKKWLAHSATN